MNIDFESRNITRRSFLKGAGVVGAAGLLSACGGSKSNNSGSTAASGAEAPNSTGATPLKEYISWESANREIESWNLLYSQTLSDANVVTNLWDGLMSFDCYGKLVPAIATSWEANEDSTVWTFHLRDDVDWVDCNGEVKEHITATDFLVGLEWVLNASKNEANNTSMPTLYIVGAEEYYEKTKDMGAAAADLRYQDMLDAGVGIEAPDDYTLVFTCKHSCPYFDTVASYTSFYPASQVLIDELGIDGEKYDGKTMVHLRKSTADSIAALKKQAMDELTAIGVTFPVKAPFFFVAGNTVAQDNATVLKQCFTDSFGDDFIQLDLGTYVSSLAKEVRIPKLHGFVINGWGADFGDPVNFVGQEILHDSNAYYAVNYSNIQLVAEDPADYQKELVDEFEQFTDLVNAANAIVDDTDARYEAFAKAEAYMINNSLAVPCYYDVRWCLTHVNEYTKINAMFGPCNFKYVNWETSEDAYTTTQYEEFAKAFDAAKS